MLNVREPVRGGAYANISAGWSNDGVQEIVYVPRAMPDPGASRFAKVDLDLVQFLPSGTGATWRRQWQVTSRPMYALPWSYVSGIPTIAGSLISQPLYNPRQGFTRKPGM